MRIYKRSFCGLGELFEANVPGGPEQPRGPERRYLRLQGLPQKSEQPIRHAHFRRQEPVRTRFLPKFRDSPFRFYVSSTRCNP